MKRISLILLCLFVTSCFAQNDSLVIQIGEVSFVMIKIPANTFEHYNYYGDTISECTIKPVVEVRKMNETSTIQLKSYYIGKYEVTQKLYSEIMKKNPSDWKRGSYPVINVTWYDVQIFIDSLNKLTGMKFRLPTEMEWENAAAGDDWSSKYCGSNILEDVAWTTQDVGPFVLHTVGKKHPNNYGLYDMSGNVYEWCNDWFSTTFYKPQKLYKNPKGPDTGDKKIIKGGCWGIYSTRFYEYRTRVGASPYHKDGASGFRLAMDAE